MQAEVQPEGARFPDRHTPRCGTHTLLLLLILLLSGSVPEAASARESRVARAQRGDGPVYFVGELVPQYAQDRAGLPSLEALEKLDFELGRTVDGYIAPREGVQRFHFRMTQLASAPTQRIYASGLRYINEQVVTWLNRNGLRGVRVRPHPDDIEPGTNRDLRPRDETRLRILILAPVEETEIRWESRASSGDGPVYMVDEVLPEYVEYHPNHPRLAELDRVEFELGRTSDGYIAPKLGVRMIRFRLSDLRAAPTQRIYASGLRSLNEQIVAWLNAQGLTGVLIRPHEEDIDPETNEDRRPETRPQLRLLIWTGRVRELRTFASGDRIQGEERANHPAHERIVNRSPIKPGAVRGQDLVQKDVLDDYAARLNRHPGRRVDVALSPALEPGGVNVDYMISENKPWTAYASWNNTGTDATTDSRERFGFTHTQVSGRDDILSLDYVTGNFDDVNAIHGSYSAPFFGYEGMRWRVHGSASEFDSSVLGFPGRDYEGKQRGAGVDLTANVYQRGNLFVDLLGGLRWQYVEVDNPLALANADDTFLIPRAGLILERRTETSSLLADLVFEMNASNSDADDPTEMGGLGRLDPDESWNLLRWNSSFTSYLEPWLYGAAWADTSSPATSTLAHEIAVLFRGQYAFDKRLIPQEETIAGGFFTVRGYPQAAAAGDSVFIGSLEYRFHVPRLFPVQKDPLNIPVVGDFRIAPQRAFGRPDWDLVLRAFVDGARVLQSDRISFEADETLIGVGIGAELQLWRNVIGRVDFGMALHDVDSDDVDTGDTEVHLSVTTLY